MAGRTIAIGDIHGCSAALRAVLQAVQITQDDTIVTLGDYIDRGPDSKGVIEQLLELDQACEFVPLMGNHELMLLLACQQTQHLAWWKDCGGVATLLSYYEHLSADEANQLAKSHAESDTSGPRMVGPEVIPQRHIEFIESCAMAYETETHIFVHANYDANVPLDEQDDEVLLWHHLNQPPGPHVSGKKVIVGHTPQVSGEILDLGYLVCIDTFCFGTGWLTALEVSTGETWQANRQGELRLP